MRFRSFFSLLAVLAASLGGVGCAQQPAPAESTQPMCGEPRPQVCTMIYAPVCARHGDGREETLASACNACAIETVIDYRDGSCEGAAL